MEESRIRVSSFCKDLYPERHTQVQKFFGKEFKLIKTPMSEGYHPEIDDLPLCTNENSAKYRFMIGCFFWNIVLRRFDVAYATSAMRMFVMLPEEGNLMAVKRILLFLMAFPKGMIIVDTSYPDHSVYPIENHLNWREFYLDAEEEIPNDIPTSKRSKFRMTDFVDVNHAHNLFTRRSITGILVMLNNAPLRRVS